MSKTPQIRWGGHDGERVSFLRDNYPTMGVKALTEAFNLKFGTAVTDASVGFQLHRFRILKGKPNPVPQSNAPTSA